MTNGDDRRPGGTGTRRVHRSRRDRVVGGVCAGIAHHFGVDPALVRLVTLLLAVVSGGTAVLAYLAAWVLLPVGDPDRVKTGGGAPPRLAAVDRDAVPADRGVRTAWNTVGAELRTLAGGLRPAGRPVRDEQRGGALSPLGRADALATALGDRLRDPQVQADARRAATSLSAALGSTADELARRTRRNAPPAGPGD